MMNVFSTIRMMNSVMPILFLGVLGSIAYRLLKKIDTLKFNNIPTDKTFAACEAVVKEMHSKLTSLTPSERALLKKLEADLAYKKSLVTNASKMENAINSLKK